MILLEGALGGVVALVLSLLFAPPACMFITGFFIRKKHKKGAKILFIMGTVYLLIGLGIWEGVIF